MQTLSGKMIWLTGASSGIGEALAYELAKRGVKLAITARRGEILNAMVEKIEASGGKAFAVPADVTDLAVLKDAARKIEAWGGPIDMVIANAGTHVVTKPEHFNAQEYIDLMNINFGGSMYTIEAALPKMLERKKGRVVVLASLAGSRGLPTAAAYGASKAALINFLESIRFHLKEHNVGVTIINPGFVKTPLTDKNDFEMPFLIDAGKSARIIADGLEKEKNDISYPIPFSWIIKTARVLPYAVYEFLVTVLWSRMENKK